MVVPRTVKQSSCIFGETNAGSCSKSPPYHYVPGWLESRVTWVQSAVDSAIDTGFYKLLSVFAKLYTPHKPKFHIPTIGKCRNNSKTAPISLYFVAFDHGFVYISAIFSMVNITGGIPNLFHVLISTLSCMQFPVWSPTGRELWTSLA